MVFMEISGEIKIISNAEFFSSQMGNSVEEFIFESLLEIICVR